MSESIAIQSTRGCSGDFTGTPEPFRTDCLLVGHAKRASLVFTFEQWFALCLHMLQDNDSFLMPYLNKNGEAKFARSKPLAKGGKVRVEKRIEWSWEAICGRAKNPASIGFYPKNERGQSRWAAFDVDAHDGDAKRAREAALKLFGIAMAHTQLVVVLATSGSAGFHLFFFTREFRPCGEWTRLLRQIANMAGLEIRKGHVEIFPDETRGFGYGIRAPGTWNPKTGCIGLIVFESVTSSPLLHDSPSPFDSSGKEITSLSVRGTTGRKPGSSPNSAAFGVFRGEHGQWQTEFAINAARQRHEQLIRFVGNAFWQCGRNEAEENARLQYAEAKPEPTTPLDGHLAEFSDAWRGLDRQWRASLTPEESVSFDALETDTQRDAFRIIRSWARHEKNQPHDFYINAEALGRRLGITPRGAAKLRRRFCQL